MDLPIRTEAHTLILNHSMVPPSRFRYHRQRRLHCEYAMPSSKPISRIYEPRDSREDWVCYIRKPCRWDALKQEVLRCVFRLL
ncbi:hypothetical protein Pan258_18770 [Symmachiella dynata]|nr:hypothetical protein Pan258_18770 [Symmachiella dynata]